MSGPWGTGGWGGGAPFGGSGPLSISYAFAASVRSVRVVLTAPPRGQSDATPGDALNPATWSVTRGDTGGGLNVLRVERVDAATFDVHVLERLGPHLVDHTLATGTLLAPNGSLLLPPRAATFDGVAEPSQLATAGRSFASRDLANPYAPDAVQVGGTLVVDSTGDYALVQGKELLRKLIFRRLVTRPGDFFHLPDYGIGIREKEPIPGGDLVQLKNEIERQVLREPEIAAVEARIEFAAAPDSVLTVRLAVTEKRSGQVFGLSFPLPAGLSS